MASPLTLSNARVSNALDADQVAVTVRNNLLTIAQRGGAVLASKVPVSRVERVSAKNYRVTDTDGNVYEVVALARPCGCGGGR